jgi:hypothetical protein
VFEDRVLRRITFRHKINDVRGGWRKLYNEELDLHNSMVIITGGECVQLKQDEVDCRRGP